MPRYDKCCESRCNNYIPSGAGRNYCHEHKHFSQALIKTVETFSGKNEVWDPTKQALVTLPAAVAPGSILLPEHFAGVDLTQCEHFYADGNYRCSVLTPNSLNGKAYCRLHLADALAVKKSTEVPQASLYTTKIIADDSDPNDPENIDELEWIDWEMYNKQKFEGARTYRQGKYIDVETVHFRFKFKASEGIQNLFHAMLRIADTDYPLDPDRKRNKPLRWCTKCKAWEWYRAVPNPDEIRRAAKQAGVDKLKIVRWLSADKCKGKIVDKLADAVKHEYTAKPIGAS